MTTKSYRDQEIEQVAGAIYELRMTGFSDEELREANGRDGWSFEIRYQPTEERYVSDSDYTRVEGVHLALDELDRAFAIATGREALRAGPGQVDAPPGPE